MPSASTDIVANLGPPMRLLRGEGPALIRGATVTGLTTAPMILGHPPVHEAVGVRLSPLGWRRVLGLPPAAALDGVINLADVLPSGRDELTEACLAVEGQAARLQAALQWLRGRLQLAPLALDPVARWAIEQIEITGGREPIGALQQRTGYSRAWLNRRFLDELGLTPKRYARLVRFRRALDLLTPERPLADLALSLGYHDQAHMHRDFRLIGETTPQAVLAARYASGLSLADEG